jgi:hypothetical protein
MGTAGDVRANTDAILGTAWNRRTGQAVPKTDDVALKNGAVDLEAVVLYADLCGLVGACGHDHKERCRSFPCVQVGQV